MVRMNLEDSLFEVGDEVEDLKYGEEGVIKCACDCGANCGAVRLGNNYLAELRNLTPL